MADIVRRRFTAARAGVMMAVFGLAAGLGIRAGEPPDQTVEVDPAAAKTLTIAKNKVGSSQIKNGSLLYKDIKPGQVVSHKDYKIFSLKITDAFLKLDAANLLHKADVYNKLDSDARFVVKGDAVGRALKADSAGRAETAVKAETSLKLDGLSKDQLVQGRGAVITGNLTLGDSNGTVMVLIGMLRAEARNAGGGNSEVTLFNTSGQTLFVNGDNGKVGTIVPSDGNTKVTMADGSVRPVQVVSEDGTKVATLTFSSFAGGQNKELIAQALIGLL